jgi:diacylglycerol kinase family enzyme
VVGALDAYADGVEHIIDLATVNGRVFVNNATAGLYAKIVQSPEYRGAKRQTTIDMLPDLLGPDATPLDLRFSGPDGTAYPTAHVILVSNNPYQLRSLAGMGTRERLDLAVLGIVTIRISSAGDASAIAALEAAGQPQRYKGWLEWTAPKFQIDSGAPIEVGLDGEALKLDPPLVFETRPRALRVRVPQHALGRSPAATGVDVLSQATIAQLVRVTGGHAPG